MVIIGTCFLQKDSLGFFPLEIPRIQNNSD